MTRSCSECGASLEGRRPQTLTCSTYCRIRRHRRLNKPPKGARRE